MAAFKEERIDENQAAQQFIAFDESLHGGKMSKVGTELFASLVTTLGTIEAGRSSPEPATHSAAGGEHADDVAAATRQVADAANAAPPAQAPGKTYLSKYTSLGGTNLEQLKTTRLEAHALNRIRASDKRFDPAWLAKAQASLGVTATGSFNTETLRALRAQHPKLDAAAILSDRGGVLTSLAPGQPFIETPPGLTGEKHEEVGPTKADRAAQRLGYPNYQAYSSQFEPAMFLGVPLNKGQGSGLAHPHLLGRLRVAETFLRQRHAGMPDKEIVKAIGWNAMGNAAYADAVKYGVSHFHTMGLAVDIDVEHNPYVFTGRLNSHKGDSPDAREKQTEHNWWMDVFEKHFAYAAKIYGGEPISAKILDEWADEMSSDELWAKVHQVSSSLHQYMQLASESDDKIRAVFEEHGVPVSDIAEMKKIPGWFHNPKMGRGQADSLTNHSQELIVALRDVAGLSWGGAEMSANENGDFMHFDCRQDNFGSVLQHFNFP